MGKFGRINCPYAFKFKNTLDFFPNPDFCGFLKTSTPILIKVYF
ncbi:hypothetical protein [Moraxella lacunata]